MGAENELTKNIFYNERFMYLSCDANIMEGVNPFVFLKDTEHLYDRYIYSLLSSSIPLLRRIIRINIQYCTVKCTSLVKERHG